MGLCYDLTLSVMRNDNGNIYPVSINKASISASIAGASSPSGEGKRWCLDLGMGNYAVIVSQRPSVEMAHLREGADL
jgi:hypothetical protein